MSTIKYQVEFFSLWHCGSGLSAGTDVDALVIKDKDGLPFIPGKTIKGLVREAVENYLQFTNKAKQYEIDFKQTFGLFSGNEDFSQGQAFFSNANLSDEERTVILDKKMQDYLYNKVTSTAIGEDGIAKDHSLRAMETVVPCTLIGTITDIPETMIDIIEKSLGLIKRMGQKRNRGLGRCEFKVLKKGGDQ